MSAAAVLCAALAAALACVAVLALRLRRVTAASTGPRETAGSGLAAGNVRAGELMERCGAAIAYLATDGRIIDSNAPARAMLGVAVPAERGAGLLEATLCDELLRHVRHVASTGERVRADVRLGAGGKRVLAVEIGPAHDGPGKQRLILLAATDVTELRWLETVRRDFVANVSHELRTPLASIRATAETLQSGAMEDPEYAGRFLQTIMDESDRLTRIAHDLLVLSDAESLPPERTRFALAPAIECAVERLAGAADAAGIHIECAIEPDLQVDASYDQLQQVLVNLVDNGIKYTHAGGSVRIAAAPEGAFARVSVADTGIGIMREHLPRLFERFYRVDKARSRKSGGTGLGLSIVRRIVEAHGGEVTVASEFNHGSTFTFTVPLAPR